MEVKIGVRVGGRETVLKILEMHCATSSLTVQTFFEASAAVITFVLAGRYVEAQMKLKTGDSVRKLAQMTPRKAWVKTGGGFSEVDSAQVEPGPLVEMRELFTSPSASSRSSRGWSWR